MNVLFNKQRIFDYLDGKVTALEMKQIEEWSGDPANEELFYSWLDEWERAHLQYTADNEGGLSTYQDFLSSDEKHPGKPAKASPALLMQRIREASVWRYWWAACIALVLLLGAVAFPPYDTFMSTTYITKFGETRSLQLSDGSSVVLQANSSLKVPRFGFGHRSREVQLHGEAMFSVVHSYDRRFVVKTANATDIIVLGTEFSVYARARGTKVRLNRGKVQIRYHNKEQQLSQLEMEPGDQVVLSPGGEIVKEEMHEEETGHSWVAHQFRFNRTPLSEIIVMLAENYNLSVEVSGAGMKALSLSGTYEAHGGEELLQIIAEVLGLDLKQEKNKYILVSQHN